MANQLLLKLLKTIQHYRYSNLNSYLALPLKSIGFASKTIILGLGSVARCLYCFLINGKYQDLKSVKTLKKHIVLHPTIDTSVSLFSFSLSHKLHMPPKVQSFSLLMLDYLTLPQFLRKSPNFLKALAAIDFLHIYFRLNWTELQTTPVNLK